MTVISMPVAGELGTSLRSDDKDGFGLGETIGACRVDVGMTEGRLMPNRFLAGALPKPLAVDRRRKGLTEERVVPALLQLVETDRAEGDCDGPLTLLTLGEDGKLSNTEELLLLLLKLLLLKLLLLLLLRWLEWITEAARMDARNFLYTVQCRTYAGSFRAIQYIHCSLAARAASISQEVLPTPLTLYKISKLVDWSQRTRTPGNTLSSCSANETRGFRLTGVGSKSSLFTSENPS